MFICTGNICRSAMAHKLMEKKLQDRKRTDIQVYSCGTFAEDGDTADAEAKEVMKEYGVDMKSHQAVNMYHSPIQEMDLILCATTTHKQFVLRQYPELEQKVYTLKEYVGEQDKDISDPWGYDIATFRFCAAKIEECLEKLLEKIEST